MRKSVCISFGLSVFVVLWVPGSSHAQWPYPYPPYYPGWGYGPWSGRADAIAATGQLMINQEQARTERENTKQARLQTQKMAFDQALYEKAMTPSYGEDQILVKNKIIQRMLTRPDQWQITDGVTLNTLIPFVNDLATKGIMGPTIPLDPNYVKLLNVTVGTDGPKVAFLKEGQQLDWPFVLQGPKQEKLDTLVKQAALETANGKLQAKTYDAIFPL